MHPRTVAGIPGVHSIKNTCVRNLCRDCSYVICLYVVWGLSSKAWLSKHGTGCWSVWVGAAAANLLHLCSSRKCVIVCLLFPADINSWSSGLRRTDPVLA
jgi:hypothetical protein